MSEREEKWFPNWDNVEVRERYYKEKEQDKNNRREHIAWKRCKNCGRVWKMKPYEQPLLNEKCSYCGKSEMVYYFRDKPFLSKGSLSYWCGRENNINLEDNKGMEVKMRDIKERKISGSGVSEVEEAKDRRNKTNIEGEVLIYADIVCSNCGCQFFWIEPLPQSERGKHERMVWTCADCLNEVELYPVYVDDLIYITDMEDGESVYCVR